MEDDVKIEIAQKLNTKGCCFICLKCQDFNESNSNENYKVEKLKLVSMKHFLRHLRITEKSGKSSFHKMEDIQADLCNVCERITASFSIVFKKLEKVQLEMDYLLDGIHQRISQSANDPDLVQNYSKRMTSDGDTLTQLAFVDKLRKDIAKKSLKGKQFSSVRVILTRVNASKPNPSIKLIKEELDNAVEEEIMDDRVVSERVEGIVEAEDTYSPDIISQSPPPSPATTEGQEFKLNQGFNEPALQKVTKTKTKQSNFFIRDQNTKIYKCRKCEKASEIRVTIEQHFKRIHLQKRHKCEICNVATFTQAGHLSAHRKTCRQKLERKLAKEKDPKFFVCEKCEKRFGTRHGLNSHRQSVHLNANRYACSLCDKKYTSKFMLKCHHEAVHLSRMLHCKVCCKMYKDAWKFKTHEKNCIQKSKIKLESV